MYFPLIYFLFFIKIPTYDLILKIIKKRFLHSIIVENTDFFLKHLKINFIKINVQIFVVRNIYIYNKIEICFQEQH